MACCVRGALRMFSCATDPPALTAAQKTAFLGYAMTCNSAPHVAATGTEQLRLWLRLQLQLRQSQLQLRLRIQMPI